ncbi:hypothetical protein JCM10450v2_004108 [Rhodotorula kratochvilovae]
MAGGAVTSGVKAAGPTLSKRQEYFAFALITSLFFLWGISYGMVDVLNAKVQTSFGISKLQSTMLQVAYFGAYAVVSIPASMFASRFGYKKGVIMGLSLYTAGALAFWPSAHYEKYFGFVISAFIIASGLATLETMANSYITVLGSPDRAAFRLNFAQSFNGLAAFLGPLIASKTFLTEKEKDSLTSVQYVYLAVACLGIAVAILFIFATLPEITEESLEEQQDDAGIADGRPLWKRKHTVFGFIAQFAYVGAQVTTASFVVNFFKESPHNMTGSQGAEMLTYAQVAFMVSRFASTGLLRFFDASLLLATFGGFCTIGSLLAALAPNAKGGMAGIFIVFIGESLIYPTVFSLATSNLGKHTKRGAGLLCMGVSGGAIFPPMQGALADARSTTLSYVIPAAGFSFVIAYGIGMFFYTRRMAALVEQNAALAPAVERYEEKEADSVEKIEDKRYEGAIRV